LGSAVVLHLPSDDLPAFAVPTVRVTAIGTTAIAVPDLVFTGGAGRERRKAGLGDAWLTRRGTVHTTGLGSE
jgi:hypothetical protein